MANTSGSAGATSAKEEKQTSQRRRPNTSCLSCQKSKVKCSSEEGTCKRCANSGIECVRGVVAEEVREKRNLLRNRKGSSEAAEESLDASQVERSQGSAQAASTLSTVDNDSKGSSPSASDNAVVHLPPPSPRAEHAGSDITLSICWLALQSHCDVQCRVPLACATDGAQIERLNAETAEALAGVRSYIASNLVDCDMTGPEKLRYWEQLQIINQRQAVIWEFLNEAEEECSSAIDQYQAEVDRVGECVSAVTKYVWS